MRKTLYKIHKYAGLTLGFILFLVALSGVMITFRQELLPVIYPKFRVTPTERKAPLETIVRNAATYLKGLEIHQIYATPVPDSSYLMLYEKKPKALPTIVAINQYTGGIQGEMNLVQNIFAIMLYFHSNFFLGKAGTWAVGFTGALLVFFIVSGIIVWLPKKNYAEKISRTLKVKWTSQSLHHFLGVILAVPLFISAVSGFITVFDIPGRNRPDEIKPAGSCTLEEQISALSFMNAEQQDKMISVHFCHEGTGIMKLSWSHSEMTSMAHFSRIIVNPVSKEIIQKFDSEKDPAEWNMKRQFFYPLHTGEIIGMPGRLIVLIGGLGLMALFLSGLTLYRRRKKNVVIPAT
ncbi:MAG: PepSY-associated TM helix domain-containing protein [Bdellovibrionota bacterium]